MRQVRIAIAQLRPRKADYQANLGRVGSVFAQLAGREQPADVVVFPETAVSGYFLEGGVREVAVTAGSLVRDLEAQHAAAGAPPIDVVIGFYEEFRNRFHNSAMCVSLGGDSPVIRHIHRKIFLPTYGVFDEQRFVQPAHEVQAFDTQWGRAAMVICEDAWHSIVPALAALDGAHLLFVPSASPARGVVPAKVLGGTSTDEPLPSSLERWERLVRTIAAEHGVFVALAQLVGFEGGKGFPGVSMVVGPSGDLLSRGPLFDEALIVVDCDMGEVTRARADAPLLADLEAEMPHLIRNPSSAASRPLEFDQARGGGATGPTPGPGELTVHGERRIEDPLAIDPELVTRWLVAFIREEVVTRRGFAKAVVGLSGGVDSSLAAFLATQALGKENVVGVRMPYRTSSPQSLQDAALVAAALGITLETVDITAAVDGLAGAIEPPPAGTRLGNVMARTRMITLFDLSATHGALPLGTGNKSERLLGYFTWHADDSPPVNPLGDLFKTEVWAIARHVGVPAEIVAKPATADLITGQTDEDDLGISYPTADQILHWLLRGLTRDEITHRGFAPADVALVADRLDSTHWKRRLPTVAMVSQTAIGECYLRPVDF